MVLPARLAIVSVAVVVCAWFAVGVRQAIDTDKADAIATGTATVSADQASHADSLLHAAGFLNPDLEVDLLRGTIALDRQQHLRAVSIFQSVTRREPENIDAWLTLAQAEYGEKRPLAVAVAQIAKLDPILARNG
jgi:predicted Zn-dependent protease